VDFTNPYEEVQIRGRIIERRPDSDFKLMDSVSHKYTGKPFPMRNPEGRVALIIEVEKIRYTKLPFEHTPPKLKRRGSSPLSGEPRTFCHSYINLYMPC
jgi:hypothetical protein